MRTVDLLKNEGLLNGTLICKGYAQTAAAQICRQRVCDWLFAIVVALFFDELFVGLSVDLVS